MAKVTILVRSQGTGTLNSTTTSTSKLRTQKTRVHMLIIFKSRHLTKTKIQNHKQKEMCQHSTLISWFKSQTFGIVSLKKEQKDLIKRKTRTISSMQPTDETREEN